MLKDLTAPKGALVIVDAGIATAANIAWLKKQEYRYLVVSHERARQFDPDNAVDMLTASNETIQLQRVVNDDGTEVRLYCRFHRTRYQGDRDRGTLRDPVRDRSRQPRRWSEQATHTEKVVGYPAAHPGG